MTYRTRTKAESTIVTVADYTYVYRGGAPSRSTLSWNSRFGSSSCNDVSNPGFRRIMSQGGIVAGEASVSHSHVEEQPGTINAVSKNQPNTYFNWNNYPVMSGYGAHPENEVVVSGSKKTISTQERADLLARAKQQCIERINKSPVNMMEDALELEKTVALLRNPIANVSQISRKLKRLDSRALSSAWLNARFVYGQLIYSAMSINETVFRLQHGLLATRNNARFTARSTGLGIDRTSDYLAQINYTDYVGHNCRYHVNSRETASFKCGIMYELKKFTPDFGYYSGLRLRNVPRGVWNILPYTWVTDRFFDVSSMIQGCINLADPNVKVLYGWENTRTSFVRDRTMVSETHPDWTVTVNGSDKLETSGFSRKTWWPTIADTAPVFNTDTFSDLKQSLDLASLVLNRIGPRLGK